nr:MAG TPA: hypothetical protein [Caudoviricetes sp.]
MLYFSITTKKPLLLRKDLGNRGFFSNKRKRYFIITRSLNIIYNFIYFCNTFTI